ncbi:MAPEG family protein [Tahibacter amnicola]|uniref:MAPEG family protein n=1 Tax=Tahibacter amnicola TaxID=2976241 RepID=A0ABY6BJX1_9GAMM|nr:MAPEG family protein [Tahibacter amnicola]UXI70184.1 MAPEG family protein [Tahibacter amnicola]
MSRNLILLPALAQVLLTIAVYVRLAAAKAKAVREGQVDPERRGLYDDAWPASVQKVNNNIRNQFEVPVLFYVLTIMLWQLGTTGPLAQALAWLFVGSRIVHAYIHTGSNIVPVRRKVFMAGCAIVVAMTVLVIWSILFA